MGNYNKWNRDEDHESDKLTVVLFVSRNKDNKKKGTTRPTMTVEVHKTVRTNHIKD